MRIILHGIQTQSFSEVSLRLYSVLFMLKCEFYRFFNFIIGQNLNVRHSTKDDRFSGCEPEFEHVKKCRVF